MDQSHDADLVFRCLEGDTDAFGVLVKRYQSAVFATSSYYVGRYGAVEDVAQEAFWAAYRSLPHLKNPERFGSWMKGITTRTAANWLRRNLPRLEQETPLPHRRTVSIEDARQAPDNPARSRERYEGVLKAIDSLPERYRLPVILRYMQELSYEEISRFTGDSREEVRGILQRAGRQLREILSDLNDEEEGDARWHHAHR
jgi:RNA polymerase sigma-70 factor, ECF subfamily